MRIAFVIGVMISRRREVNPSSRRLATSVVSARVADGVLRNGVDSSSRLAVFVERRCVTVDGSEIVGIRCEEKRVTFLGSITMIVAGGKTGVVGR
jgi:hypothetical protein